MDADKLPGLLKQFNSTIKAWIDYLDDYTIEMLQQHVTGSVWSLGQVYTHIIDDTTYFVTQMKIAAATDDNNEQMPQAGAKELFTNNAFPDIKIAGPATDTFIQQPDSIAALLQALEQIRDEVNKLFSSEIHNGKTAHPGLGYFTAKEWLQFADIHMRHHFRQKKRIDYNLFGIKMPR
jgi:myosin-crossreactive antigen